MITIKLDSDNIKEYYNIKSKKELLEFVDKHKNDRK